MCYTKYVIKGNTPEQKKGIDTMTNTNKLTKRDYFTIIREAYPVAAENYDEVIAFIDHELELLAKKNAANRKPTAAQIANEGTKDVILSVLKASGKPMTITDMMKANAELSDLSNQRITTLTTQLVKADVVLRTVEKGKAYFTLA